MKKLIALLIFLSAVSAFAQTESRSQLRQKTFEKVWQTINDKYFDPAFGGVDWEAIHARYTPQVGKVKTDAELYKLLDKMLGELKVSHLQILTPETMAKLKSPPVATGVILREVENKVVITRLIEDSAAAKAGLKTGFTVVKVGGEPVSSLADAQRKFAGAPNTTLRLSYLNEKDEPREMVLERLPLNQLIKGNLAGMPFYAFFESKRLAGGIGYLRFSNFAAFLNPKIKESIESMKDAPGIIIDLRGNSGGEDLVAINLAGLLFDRETQLMVSRTRWGDDFYYKAKPQKDAFSGRVVILIDELSGSASEQLSAGLQESGRAFIIGKTSIGKDLDADIEKLPTGAYLIYATGEPRTPKGAVIEGRGVIPNLEVNLTRRDLLAGKDTQLEAAIDYIKSGKQ